MGLRALGLRDPDVPVNPTTYSLVVVIYLLSEDTAHKTVVMGPQVDFRVLELGGSSKGLDNPMDFL